MIYRFLLFIFGLVISTIGVLFTMINVSYLQVDYAFSEYLMLILKRFESWLIPIGLLFMLIACFAKFKIFNKTII